MTDSFSLEIAQSLVESDELYPVNFDDLWVWTGYSTKGNAKKALLRSFETPADYGLSEMITDNGEDGNEEIYLTVKASKKFAMLAQTSKGNEVREYFLKCEDKLKSLTNQAPKTTADMFLMSAQVLKEHDLRLNAVETRISFIEEVQTEAKKTLADCVDVNAPTVEKSFRTKVKQIVAAYCELNNVPYSAVYTDIYSDFDHAYGKKLGARVNNEKKKGRKNVTKLDIVEELGMMEQLYLIANGKLRNNV